MIGVHVSDRECLHVHERVQGIPIVRFPDSGVAFRDFYDPHVDWSKLLVHQAAKLVHLSGVEAELEQIWNDGFVPLHTPLARKYRASKRNEAKRTKPCLGDVNFNEPIRAAHESLRGQFFHLLIHP